MDKSIRKLLKEEFPQHLLEIPQPPKQLFVQGALPGEDLILLTVVGSRKYSNYGKEICEKLIGGLSGYGIAIVSGLAIGIDTIAHKVAISTGLKTIAVPGSGLNRDVLYPATNRLLAQKIIENDGALLSEFDPDFRATVWSFPQRNRIMAGLSHATLIIEAENKSGTLITARMALDYNRDVLAVPGSLLSRTSQGTNTLLRQGATPITSSEDILEALGFGTPTDKSQTDGSRASIHIDCSPEERRVLEILRDPITRDELIHELEMPITQANVLLSSMEIKGLVIESFGQMRVG